MDGASCSTDASILSLRTVLKAFVKSSLRSALLAVSLLRYNRAA